MTGECKVTMDSAADAAQHTSLNIQASQRSRLSMALMAVVLCLAAAAAAAAAALLVLNMNAKDPGPDQHGYDLRHTLRHISNVRAAIHLEGEYNPNVTTSVKWMSGVDQFHSQGGLELKNNEIVIPRNGLYFVYSQASFRVSCSSSDADDITSKHMVHVSHTVKRWSSTFGDDDEESYQTILHSVRTACQKTAGGDSNSDGSWFSAVYMGAVFHLKTGDRLKTVMEKKMLEKLEDEPGKTFFGVFAL